MNTEHFRAATKYYNRSELLLRFNLLYEAYPMLKPYAQIMCMERLVIVVEEMRLRSMGTRLMRSRRLDYHMDHNRMAGLLYNLRQDIA